MISGINCQVQAMLAANLVAMIVQSTQSPTAADRRDRSGSMKDCGLILGRGRWAIDRVPKYDRDLNTSSQRGMGILPINAPIDSSFILLRLD